MQFCSIIFGTIYWLLFFENVKSNEYSNYIQTVYGENFFRNCVASEKCCNALGMSTNRLKMIDASSKLIPSGVLAGNMNDLGKFDECFNIYEKIGSTEIFGKYCLASAQLPSYYQNARGLSATKLFSTGSFGAFGMYQAFCMPNDCSPEDFKKLIPSILDLTFTEETCFSKANLPELSTGAILTIVVIAVVLTLMVLSTIYDIYLYYFEKESKHILMLAFSAMSNGKKIFQSTSNPDQLLCLNGIKAISMMWVILGHGYISILAGAVDNLGALSDAIQDSKLMFISSADLAVDSFFAVGGLVTVYTVMKANARGVKLNIPMFYIHRYLRLTPAVAIMILIHAFLLPYFGNGPFWNKIEETFTVGCRDYWWSALLYVQNYVNFETLCVPQTWYLSVDFQLFLLSPLVLIPLTMKRIPKRAKLIGFATLILLGMVVPFTVAYIQEIQAFSTALVPKSKESNALYNYTHTRFGPYVVGMFFGYIVHLLKSSEKKIKIKRIFVCIGWIITLVGLLSCVYGSADTRFYEYNRFSHSFYLGVNRSAWAIGVCLMSLLCIAGYGGPIDKFLSHPVFQFLTKLSYSMYLLHVCIITLKNYAIRVETHFSHYNLLTSFWGDFMFTLVISLLLCLAFESPVIVIEKVIFGKASKRSAKKKNLGNQI